VQSDLQHLHELHAGPRLSDVQQCSPAAARILVYLAARMSISRVVSVNEPNINRQTPCNS
jgi:hypothetical protein